MARKYAAHIGQGTLRGLGPGYWYGGPWLGITLLHAVKQGQDDIALERWRYDAPELSQCADLTQ